METTCKRVGLILALLCCLIAVLPGTVWGQDHIIDNPDLLPEFLWTRGCSPTSASMALGYYDYIPAGSLYGFNTYGVLIDFYLNHPSNGRNVPNLLDELADDMGTDPSGATFLGNIGPGIESAANHHGYSFNSVGTFASSAPWCWPQITHEIDVHQRPFVWSVCGDDPGTTNDPAHSLCAWGYTDALEVIVYTTWGGGREDWFYAQYDNTFPNIWAQVDTVEPGGGRYGQNVILWTPVGGETFVTAKTETIQWYQVGTDITSVDIFYSTDGGQSWAFIATIPSTFGWNSHDWLVPNPPDFLTTEARVRIYHWPIGADGSFDNFTMVQDRTPPSPDPMTWATAPYETSTTAIAMIATTATDEHWPPVYYEFDYYSSPTGGAGGTDSGWQTSTSYSDTGLSVNHQYGYRVRAKDSAPSPNTTGYSVVSYDYTDIQAPSGITFGTITSASIQAKSLNTPSGLNRGSSGLKIENVTSVTDSGWKQDNNYWTSSSLSPNTNYGFKAKARNGDSSETGYCTTAYRYTLAAVPTASAFSDVTETSIRANWTANGNPAGTLYLCENTTAATNSGWTSSTSWNSTGLSPATLYSFRVKAKNAEGVETAWRSLGSQETLPGLEDVSLELVPDSTTVPRNGTLGYTVTATNNTGSVKTVQYWTNVTLPNGNTYPVSGALFGPTGSITLNPYASRSAHLTEQIPPVAPLGTYSYNGYVGTYPAVIQTENNFDFTVVTLTAQADQGQEN